MKEIESYKINVDNILVDVIIYLDKNDFVPTYSISILNISKGTNIILEKIRQEFISKVNVGSIDFAGYEGTEIMKKKFKKEVSFLVKKYFPNTDEATKEMLISYIVQQDIGLGDIEILLKDDQLEEIVVNNSGETVWVFHKNHGWLKTNIVIKKELKIKHYSTMIGKDVGKEITVLSPLMDAHLISGDRVNATLYPISTRGNTITIRKFAVKPWTITDYIKSNTISYESAALLWLAVQNELSVIISGGTGSGKTSMLNVLANFFPPNQRIISIEDTREITLPNSLHWVPMETRLANPEGKGEITMLDLTVNALRMRPDRIIVGEIRRKREAEVLFEAMHTGHSVYATLHANNAHETIIRLTNPPIDLPKLLMPAVSLIVVQNLNRRTKKRYTLQVAEIMPDGNPNVLIQRDVQKNQLIKKKDPTVIIDTLKLYTGMNKEEINKDLKEKQEILKWLVKNDITDIHEIGLIFAKYYTEGTLPM